MKKTIKLTLLSMCIAVLAACGGGGGGGTTNTGGGGTNGGGTNGGGTNGGGTNGGGITPVQTNTAVVLNYIEVRSSSVLSAFMSGESVIDSNLAASGQFRSGAHYSRSADNYVATIQSFLNDSVTYSRSMNTLLPVDAASVASLLRTYQIQSTNYANTYYSSVDWGLLGSPSLTSVITDIQARVNTAFDVAIASLP